MTHTEQWLRDAIAGGWKPFDDEKVHKKFEIESDGSPVFTTKVNIRRRHIADILLDPLAWQAVDSIKKWKPGVHISGKIHIKTTGWWYKMHDFIDLLAEGKSIEEALGEISK